MHELLEFLYTLYHRCCAYCHDGDDKEEAKSSKPQTNFEMFDYDKPLTVL